jgi:hypothetical protein
LRKEEIVMEEEINGKECRKKVKVKLSMGLTKYHHIKTYGGVKA